jgi:hypothetical protein
MFSKVQPPTFSQRLRFHPQCIILRFHPKQPNTRIVDIVVEMVHIFPIKNLCLKFIIPLKSLKTINNKIFLPHGDNTGAACAALHTS